MKEYSFNTQTSNAKINIHMKCIQVSPESLIEYEDKNRFNKLCEQCPNYNNKWSCPPHSPRYSEISKEFKYVYVFVFYCYLSEFSYIKMPYMKIKASNTILKAKSSKIVKELETTFSGKMLSASHCRLCKVCTCKTKESACKKSSQLRFSMESIGLNVESIARNLLNHELLWYRKNSTPEYSSVVTALLSNEIIDDEYISKLITQMTEGKR